MHRRSEALDPVRMFSEVVGSSLKAEDIHFWQIIPRAFLVYLGLIAVLRVGKKRALGRATPLDVVVVITVGSLASRGITGNASLLNTLIAVVTLIGMHWVISLTTRDHSTISDWIKGRPTRIVHDGEVNQAALLDAHMSDDDLLEDLRRKGIADPKDVKEAVLERSGELSVIKAKK